MQTSKNRTIMICLCAFGLAAPLGSWANKLDAAGTIPLKNVKEENYPGLARATLAEALSAAQQQMKDAKAVEAKLDETDDFLVYTVKMVNKDNKVSMVVLDAGNLKVLKSKDKGETYDD